MRNFKPKTTLIAIFTCAILALLSACGGGDKSTASNDSAHPPTPDSPRAYQGKGTPLFFFGGGDLQRRRAGADDPEYQQYLLWKEWREYQKYQEWLKSRPEQSTSGDEQN